MADVQVDVRYFAAAADAARCAKETIALPAAATLGDLAATLIQRHGPDMTRVLKVAAFLVEDELTRDRTQPIAPRVDILPPFAGG
ncbi:MoaD/ThiS family protein [Aldersonia sp. NBC_00410]|uniref:MoaD/ThiS family protein n=1 Tax=Aldersonia sp. NBC_00410 TaxID=2975954 RepID=UPI002250FBA6|nr:MoaD/ThiS family protein [Aldersonia sp. NBC_00410]MCX5044802.1 MoaD/ThiS family protein [Aldersonia sp. NBC_00410]